MNKRRIDHSVEPCSDKSWPTPLVIVGYRVESIILSQESNLSIVFAFWMGNRLSAGNVDDPSSCRPLLREEAVIRAFARLEQRYLLT